MYTYARGLGAAPKIPRDEAKRVVQAIYVELLLRDPWDPYDSGAEGYVNCFVEGRCTTDSVRIEIIKSREFRDKELQRMQNAYATPPASPGAPSPDAGVMALTVGGIPVVYLAGALVVLVMLLKRR